MDSDNPQILKSNGMTDNCNVYSTITNRDERLLPTLTTNDLSAILSNNTEHSYDTVNINPTNKPSPSSTSKMSLPLTSAQSHPLMGPWSPPLSPTTPLGPPPTPMPRKIYQSTPLLNHKQNGQKPIANSRATPIHKHKPRVMHPSTLKLPVATKDVVRASEPGKQAHIEANNNESESEDSSYEAKVNVTSQNVFLKASEAKLQTMHYVPEMRRQKRRISLPKRLSVSSGSDTDSHGSDDDVDNHLNVKGSKSAGTTPDDTSYESKVNTILDTPDDVEETFGTLSLDRPKSPSPIREYTIREERRNSRDWQKVTLANGEQRNIDLRAIEHYKRMFSHGGYLKSGGHNAIIVFSACYLPSKSRLDYDYVMDNLFLYALATLDQLVTEDYVLVYLHGGCERSIMPTFSWFKKCYQLIDRRLRKNLKRLYIVHPTFWVKTMLFMCRPIISSKFYNKVEYVSSLTNLVNMLPIEVNAIPDKVKEYETRTRRS